MTSEMQAQPAAESRVVSPEVLKARAALTSNLDALEEKLNFPKQLRRVGRRAKDHPGRVAAIGGGVVAVIAGAVYLVIRARR